MRESTRGISTWWCRGPRGCSRSTKRSCLQFGAPSGRTPAWSRRSSCWGKRSGRAARWECSRRSRTCTRARARTWCVGFYAPRCALRSSRPWATTATPPRSSCELLNARTALLSDGVSHGAPVTWIQAKAHAELARVRDARERQVYPYFREFETGGLHTRIAGKPVTNFSSNDYLGLTNHPKVKEAAKRAVDEYACGLSSSRPQATTTEHVRLERRFAEWMGFESCLLFTTGYQAMLGTLVSLADKDTTLVLDAYSHACILDGAFLAAGVPKNGPEIRFFNHNSARSLERILKTRERKNALVVVEGVYSLDGDTSNLPEIVPLCERYGAPLTVDAPPRTRPMRTRPPGTLNAQVLEAPVPIVVSTLSKTVGGLAGLLFWLREVVGHVQHAAPGLLV